ncbi:MAG: hypothetical protein ABFS02_04630, partial [Pseudomonadota bacterium]
MSWLFCSNVSFNRQLTGAFVVGVMVLAIVSSLAISWMVIRAEKDFVSGHWLQISNRFAAQSRLALLYQSEENAKTPVGIIFNYPDVKQAAIIDANLNVLFSKGISPDELAPGWHRDLSGSGQIVYESHRAWYFATEVRANSAVPKGTPFGESTSDDKVLGYALVAVGKNSLYEKTQELFLANTVIALTLAAALLLILRFITRRLTTPLDMLSAIMQRAEKGETGIRADFIGPKDIVDMGTAF